MENRIDNIAYYANRLLRQGMEFESRIRPASSRRGDGEDLQQQRGRGSENRALCYRSAKRAKAQGKGLVVNEVGCICADSLIMALLCWGVVLGIILYSYSY